MHTQKNQYLLQAIVHTVSLYDTRNEQDDILSNAVSISRSVLADSVGKTYSCPRNTHTDFLRAAVPFIITASSRAELSPDAPSAPALILNVSNKNDS